MIKTDDLKQRRRRGVRRNDHIEIIVFDVDSLVVLRTTGGIELVPLHGASPWCISMVHLHGTPPWYIRRNKVDVVKMAPLFDVSCEIKI
ncbi:hypothetical protein LSAT2_008853 [Lamellibrachia satsuma]|nr:hypothetical protein LSAT2_008853 [Lamellibrachia satsuma]